MKIHYMGDDNLGPRGGKLYLFRCVGCQSTHPVEVCEDNKGWAWNGSFDKPTFTPSLLVWGSRDEVRCHSFITDGKIQYLMDCFHDLKGQTVEIPEWYAENDW